MSTLLDRLRSLTRVTRRDPHLVSIVVRSYVLMVVARAVITLFPLRMITRHLGVEVQVSEADREPPLAVTPEQLRYARRVSWSIRKASPHTPTNSNCYPQALAARFLLHRKRIPSTTYYGAAFDAERAGLETHVWIRCGTYIVPGARVHRRFAVVSAYEDLPERHQLARG